MPQNDGIVQAALEHIYQNTDIEMAVVNTRQFTQYFGESFNFYDS